MSDYHDRYLRRQKRNPWFRCRFWLESRRLRRKIRARCPEGGRHEWDVLAHGPGGSAFECMKCRKEYP